MNFTFRPSFSVVMHIFIIYFVFNSHITNELFIVRHYCILRIYLGVSFIILLKYPSEPFYKILYTIGNVT